MNYTPSERECIANHQFSQVPEQDVQTKTLLAENRILYGFHTFVSCFHLFILIFLSVIAICCLAHCPVVLKLVGITNFDTLFAVSTFG